MFTLHVLTRTGSFNVHIPISYNIHSNSVIRNRPLVLVLLRGSAFDHNFIPHSGQHFYKSINSHAVSGQAATHCGLCFIANCFGKLGLVPAKCFHGFFYNVFLVHESTSRYFNNANIIFWRYRQAAFCILLFLLSHRMQRHRRFFSARVHKCRRYPFQHEFPRRRVALRPYPRIMPMIPLRVLSKEQEHGRSCSFDKEIFQLPLSGVNSS